MSALDPHASPSARAAKVGAARGFQLLWAALRLLAIVVVVGMLPGAARRAGVLPQAPSLRSIEHPGEVAAVRIEATSHAAGRVRAFRNDGSALRLVGEVELRDGHALFERIAWGDCWFVLDAAGYARASTHVMVAEATRELRMELQPGHGLMIHAVDPQGAALSDVEIELRSADPVPLGARTDATGSAQLAFVGAGRALLSARKAGYEDQLLTLSQDQADARITLQLLSAITVRVLLPGGKPAPQARVQIASVQLWPPRFAETRADGTVRIAGLAPGSYALRATQNALVTRTEVGTLVRGETPTVELQLEQGFYAAVEVVGDDEEPSPVSKARIVAAEDGLSGFPEEALTDSKGKATLGPLLRGSVTLSAAHNEYVAAPAESHALPAEGPIRIALSRGAIVEGDIRDSAGHPVDGASLRVIGTDLRGNPVEDDPKRSTFRAAHFAMLERGPSALQSAGELGVVPGPVPAIPRASGLAGAGILQTSPASLLPPSVAPAPRRVAWVSGRAGEFHLEPVTAGRLRVLVQHPEFVETLSDSITLAPGATGKLTIVLSRGGSLEGKVVDARGSPQAGVVVSMAADRGTRESNVVTASDGTFAFAATPRQVTLAFARETDPGQVILKERVEVPENDRKRVTFTLPAQREDVTLHVVSERNGAVDNAQVSVLSLVPGEPTRQTAFTDASGDALLSHVRGLQMRLEVRAPHYAPRVQVVDGQARELRVTLAIAESIAGEVRSYRGERLAGVSVYLASDAQSQLATTDDNGEYQFAELGAGAATLRYRKTGFAPLERSIQVSALGGRRATEVPRAELRAEAVVVGIVVDPKGAPVFGARVARDVAPVFLASARSQSGVAITDAQGRFVLGELAGGACVLHAYAAEVGRGATDALELAPGQTRRDVRIVLETLPNEVRDAGTASVAITLGETAEPREVVVAHVGDASSAERAGVRARDVLVAVDRTRPHTIEEARQALSGPPGDVVLVLRREGKELTLRLSRELVHR